MTKLLVGRGYFIKAKEKADGFHPNDKGHYRVVHDVTEMLELLKKAKQTNT